MKAGISSRDEVAAEDNKMFRKIVSLTLFMAFVVLVVSSVLLYVAPGGMAARRVGWSALGLGRGQWTDLHVIGGFLFLVAGAFHCWLNWRPMARYVKGKGFIALLAALLVNALIYAGTLAYAPPFDWLLGAGGPRGHVMHAKGPNAPAGGM